MPFSLRNITALLRLINGKLSKARTPNTPTELKGSSFTLSVVHLHDANPEVVRQALEDKVVQAPTFLRRASVVVNTASVREEVGWRAINEAITVTGLRIMGVSGYKIPRLKTETDRAGIPLLTEGKEKAPRLAPSESTPSPPLAANQIIKTHLIGQPVRPNQRIYVSHCDPTVINHVSAGVELIADGNIHVYGMMRGRALAGVGGDRDAQIFCTHLAAELVSITGEYWLSDNVPAELYDKAARLRLDENALTVQPLN